MPIPITVEFEGFRLIECLARQVGWRRCNSTHTTWVYGYRAVRRGTSMLLFRPGDWLLDGDGARGAPIVKDVLQSGRCVGVGLSEERSCWYALIDAPPGVRLRALVEACAADGNPLPWELAVDVARRSRPRPLISADTFVGWDGSLFFTPEFRASVRAEAPSYIGDEQWDDLVVETVADIVDVAGGAARVPRVLLGAPLSSWEDAAPADASAMLAQLARSYGAPVYDRQRQLYATVGIDVDAADAGPLVQSTLLSLSPSLAVERQAASRAQLHNFVDDTDGTLPGLLAVSEAGDVATGVPPAVAAAYAEWRGGRLPTEPEWRAASATPGFVPSGRWEWTTSPGPRAGYVVCGGVYRDSPNRPASVDNRAWEDEAAVDVGFRCVFDTGDIEGEL